MKTNYRRQRSRTQAQAGSIGAPLRGVFAITIEAVSGALGGANFFSYDTNSEGEQGIPTRWTPNKEIDPSAVRIWFDGAVVPITSLVVDAIGTYVTASFPPQIGTVRMQVVPGHPGLIASNGMACGGAYSIG